MVVEEAMVCCVVGGEIRRFLWWGLVIEGCAIVGPRWCEIGDPVVRSWSTSSGAVGDEALLF